VYGRWNEQKRRWLGDDFEWCTKHDAVTTDRSHGIACCMSYSDVLFVAEFELLEAIQYTIITFQNRTFRTFANQTSVLSHLCEIPVLPLG